ncbi:hypothetical protein MPTK2_4g19770 [Marchantia polymorpha subsp. ruderalis]
MTRISCAIAWSCCLGVDDHGLVCYMIDFVVRSLVDTASASMRLKLVFLVYGLDLGRKVSKGEDVHRLEDCMTSWTLQRVYIILDAWRDLYLT